MAVFYIRTVLITWNLDYQELSYPLNIANVMSFPSYP